MNVPQGPLIAGLGEAITVTPAATGVAVETHGIVGLMQELAPESNVQWPDLTIDMAAPPRYRVGDAVLVRGETRKITRILLDSDAGWAVYQCGL